MPIWRLLGSVRIISRWRTSAETTSMHPIGPISQVRRFRFFCCPPPSAPTAPASSPRHRTRPRGCGTCAAPRCRHKTSSPSLPAPAARPHHLHPRRDAGHGLCRRRAADRRVRRYRVNAPVSSERQSGVERTRSGWGPAEMLRAKLIRRSRSRTAVLQHDDFRVKLSGIIVAPA